MDTTIMDIYGWSDDRVYRARSVSGVLACRDVYFASELAARDYLGAAKLKETGRCDGVVAQSDLGDLLAYEPDEPPARRTRIMRDWLFDNRRALAILESGEFDLSSFDGPNSAANRILTAARE